MTSLYFYNGNLRWSLYWDNPNCWAAFLVFVLAGLWTIQRSLRVARASRLQTGCVPHPALPGKGWWRRGWRGSGRPSSAGGTPALPAAFLIAVYVIELGVWFLLVKTYSRGGLVAALVALGLFFWQAGGLQAGSRWLSEGCRATPPETDIQKNSILKGCQRIVWRFLSWFASLRDAIFIFIRSGGVARSSLNHRLQAVMPPAWKAILARLLIVAALCLAVGFASRVSPSYVAQDKSVLNRLDMWQGALVMMKDSPWVGWGNNNGGFAYINWYQPQTMTTRPVGFVNSFLDVGVEFGMPVLFAGLWIWFWLMLVAWKFKNPKSQNPSTSLRVARQFQINPKSQISNSKNEPIGREPRPFAVENGLMSAFVILAAWGVANVFTSLWRETALWVVPAGCAVYILTVWWRKGSTDIPVCANLHNSQKYGTDRFRGRRPTVCHVCATFLPAFALSAGCVAVLLSAGWVYSGKYEWVARPAWGTDKITLTKRDCSVAQAASLHNGSNAINPEANQKAGWQPALLFIDGAVFGRYFGKTFRDIAAKTTGEHFEIYPPWTRKFEKASPETKKIIYTGFQASWLGRRGVSPSQEVFIFHPTVFPPVEAADIGAARISLYMPAASASEYNMAWRRWAQRNKVQIITANREEIPL